MISQVQLDELWDFSDPEASLASLEEAWNSAADASERDEWATQIARAFGLLGRFDDGHARLDSVTSTGPAVTVRVALERGRLANSAGDPDGSVAFFQQAAVLASAAELTFLEVDALHMLAIVRPEGDDAGHALAVLDTVTDTRTLRWRVSLWNNIGWALRQAGETRGARLAFLRALAAAEQWGTPQQVRWAHEALEANAGA